jgi:hypothetical protein
MLVLSLHVTDAARGFEAHLRHGAHPPKEARADRIAAFLTEHVREGDTVQPLDWAAVGVVHGMLLAEASPATSFLYSFHFYHHVSTTYIQDLRARFIQEFDEADPAFVVEGRRGPGLPWVWGEDTTMHFPALEQRLRDRYVRVRQSPMFTIWENQNHVGRSGVRDPRSDQSM